MADKKPDGKSVLCPHCGKKIDALQKQDEGILSTILKLLKIAISGLAVLLLLLIVVVLVLGINSYLTNSKTQLSESNITLIEQPDPSVNVTLFNNFQSPAKTEFASGEVIFAKESGLAAGVKYAFRVLNGKMNVVVPLERWMQGGGGFELNSGSRPLLPGPYVIQLVKVENGRGLIAAQANFSITSRYVDLTSSQIQVWAALKGSENAERSPVLAVNSSVAVDIGIWLQGPAGKTISGRSLLFNPDGSSSGSWTFESDPTGEPTKILSMGGNAPPGRYLLQVVVEDKIVATATVIRE